LGQTGILVPPLVEEDMIAVGTSDPDNLGQSLGERVPLWLIIQQPLVAIHSSPISDVKTCGGTRPRGNSVPELQITAMKQGVRE
jgi:hypothetical protein